MDLRKLECFLAVARLQHITRASEDLGITQPALSRSIRDLERDLDVVLFTRSGRGIQITDAGQRLIEHAGHIFRAVEQARHVVGAEGRTIKGRVSIGAPPSVGNIFFSDLIERYRAIHPEVTVRVVTGMTHVLVGWLRSGAVDLGVISVAPEFPAPLNVRDLNLTPITSENFYVFAPRRRTDLPKEMKIEDLARHDLVLKDPSNMARQAIDAAARSRNLSLKVAVEVENQVVLRMLVERGIGLGVVPGSALVDDVDRFRIIRLKGLTIDRFLARAVSRPATPAIAELHRVSLLALSDLKKVGLFDSEALKVQKSPRPRSRQRPRPARHSV